MNTESDTPRTDALMPDQGHKRTMYEHILVMEAHARQLERELNEGNAKIKNPPWCAACKETDCAVSLDGTCAMIRKYQKTLTTETK